MQAEWYRDMADKSYDEIDNLMAKMRLSLGKVRQSDPVTAEELKGLLRQLEDWVESLVVDSLKLKSLEGQKPAPNVRQKPAAKNRVRK
ncbi:hypothetical protein ACFLYF_02950 [Chloroflexota bacterium]